MRENAARSRHGLHARQSMAERPNRKTEVRARKAKSPKESLTPLQTSGILQTENSRDLMEAVETELAQRHEETELAASTEAWLVSLKAHLRDRGR